MDTRGRSIDSPRTRRRMHAGDLYRERGCAAGSIPPIRPAFLRSKTKKIEKQKIKKNTTETLDLTFIKNTDILQYVSKLKEGRPNLVVGFAAETNDLVKNATKKLKQKECDWVIANDIRTETQIMGGTHNAITLISKDGVESWPKMSKKKVAQRLAELMVKALEK